MRNWEREAIVIDLINKYRSSLSIESMCKKANISRKAFYSIVNSEESVNRSTVIKLCSALHMSYADFTTIYEYKGFYLRPFRLYEKSTMDLFLCNSKDGSHQLTA